MIEILPLDHLILVHLPSSEGMTAGLASNNEIMDSMRQQYLTKRLGQPEDIASAVLYLLSESAALGAYIDRMCYGYAPSDHCLFNFSG